MVSFSLISLLGLLAIGSVQGAAIDTSTVNPSAVLQRREAVPHDSISPLPAAVRQGRVGQLMKQYQPFLKVFTGCVPFPAVDNDGNTNGGLKPSGSINGDCGSSQGQVYVRSVMCGGRRAIMYSWYMPKDQVIAGVENGHRHDWESTVVWLNAQNEKLIGLAVSGHGEFEKATNTAQYLSDGHPTIGYSKPASIDGLSHRCVLTTEVGGMQPMIDWAQTNWKVQKALQETDFGKANVPFIPGAMQDQLLKAWIGNNAPGQC